MIYRLGMLAFLFENGTERGKAIVLLWYGQTGIQKVSNLHQASRSKRNRQPMVYPFGYARCLQSYLLSFDGHFRCAFVQEEFSRNSTRSVGVSEILVVASLLRTVGEEFVTEAPNDEAIVV